MSDQLTFDFFEPIGEAAHRVVRRIHSQRYRHHMASGQWRATRERMIEKAQKRCERCGKRTNYLELHHLHYRSLGDEADGDLMVLCVRCHDIADEQRRQSECPD